MVPDFEFFLRMSHHRVIGHTIAGLPLFCLPVGLAGLVVFHRLLKYPLLSLLPPAHQAKLRPVARRFTFLPLPRLGLIILALLIGAGSHILWDALTHDDSWISGQLALLRVPVLTVGGRSLKACDVLQHLSTLAGLIALARAYRSWYLRAPTEEAPSGLLLSPLARIAVFGGMSGFACIGGLVSGLVALNLSADLGVIQTFIATTAVNSVSGFLAAWIAYSVVWHARNPGADREPASG
jgi:hypothetical protein